MSEISLVSITRNQVREGFNITVTFINTESNTVRKEVIQMANERYDVVKLTLEKMGILHTCLFDNTVFSQRALRFCESGESQ